MNEDRLKALHEQLDGSMSVLSMIKRGDITKTPQGDMLVGDVFAWSIYSDASTNVIVSEYKKGDLWPHHEHLDSIEFLICTEGSFTVTTEVSEGKLENVLTKGQCIKVPPHILHSVKANEDGKLIAVCIPPEKGYQ